MKKPKKKSTQTEDNFEMRKEWISAFEDLDRELERIIDKIETPNQK